MQYNHKLRKNELCIRYDFINQDSVNWLMEQPNGSTIMFLYLRLCILALSRPAFEIPYNPDWISRTIQPNHATGSVWSKPGFIDMSIRTLEKAGFILIEEGMITIPESQTLFFQPSTKGAVLYE